MAGIGFFGGLADSLQTGFQRQQQQDYQTQYLGLEQKRLGLEQQRTQFAQYDKLQADAWTHISDVVEKYRIAHPEDQDLKQVGTMFAPMLTQLRTLAKNLGQDPATVDARWTSIIAAPPKTQTERALAEAKETPAMAEQRRGLAAHYRDPLGLGTGGIGGGTPTGAGYQPAGQNLTDQNAQVISVEDVPPGAPLPGAQTSNQFPIGGMIKSPYTDIQGKILEAAGYTKEQADFEAIKVALGGKPPPARSKVGGIASNIIAARANQWLIENNVEPGSANARKAATTAAQSSLTQMTKNKNAIEAFETSELKNLDVLVDMAGKVDKTGIPVFERWIRSGRVATGDPDVAAFNTQMALVQAGAAKIISNPNLTGVLTDQQVQEIQRGFPSAASTSQIKSIANLLRGDFARRSQAIDEQIERIKTSFGVARPTESGSSSETKGAKPTYRFNPDTGELEAR